MSCQVNWIFDTPNGCGHDHSAPVTEAYDDARAHAPIHQEGSYATFD
jgi:hypothetical protein